MAATMSDPKMIPGVDEDTLKGAQFGLQFYLGRLTAQDENKNWYAAVADRTKTLNAMDALSLVVPCLGRKAQLLIGPSQRKGG
ncbi:hypothetical protein SAMN05444678_103121 [Sphingomonas sp. YR710]|nr:hypothetical protein SAMN05444678_103121 [Sphingomonas sp. YR710]